MASNPYDAAFHDAIRDGSRDAARLVIPDLFARWRPESVVDVGCGSGTWLSVAADEGVADLTGIDLPAARSGEWSFDGMTFVEADLTTGVPRLGRAFDLAMSIEAAEHLPESAARLLVEGLVGFAPTVLFSAAFPGRGGTGHINEQWPSYWVELFAEHGFEPREVCRDRYWAQRSVPTVLQTTVLLFVSTNTPEMLRDLPAPVMLDVVPPELWEPYVRLRSTFAWRVQREARQLMGSVRRACTHRSK